MAVFAGYSLENGAPESFSSVYRWVKPCLGFLSTVSVTARTNAVFIGQAHTASDILSNQFPHQLIGGRLNG